MHSDFLFSDFHALSKLCRGGLLRDTMHKVRKKCPRKIILAGDTFHEDPLWSDEKFERKKRRHPKQVEAIETLNAMEREDGVEIITLPGNHDPRIALAKRKRPDFIPGKVVSPVGYLWERNGVMHFVTHGHQGDPSMQTPFADFFQSLHNFIQSLDAEDPEISRAIERMFTKKIRHERGIMVPRWVINEARMRGAQHAYWAHTHDLVPKLKSNGVIGHGGVSFAEHPASYFEITDDDVKVHVLD